MRVLQIGDTHLGMKAPVLGAPRGSSRANDHLRAFDLALEPAMHEQVDLVIHTGDMFNRSRPPQASVLRAAERLVAVARRVPVLVIAGNHDRRGLFRYIPHRLAGLHVLDQPATVQIGDLRIAAIPFIGDASDWAAVARRQCEGGVDLLVAHQAFHGDQVPGFTFRVGRQRDTLGQAHMPPGLEWIMSGHLHPRQVHRLGGTTMVHGGSTERTAFSEADQVKGTVLWEWARTVSFKWLDLPTRPMVRVTREGDLRRVRAGDYVAITRDAPSTWEGEVTRRGAWLRRRSPRQFATPTTGTEAAPLLL